MLQRCAEILLQWLRVPAQPQPPHGDPASLRVFRAGRNYYNLRLVRWGFAQALALAGIIFWVAIFIQVEQEARTRRQQPGAVALPRNKKDFEEYVKKFGADAQNEMAPKDDVSTAPAKPGEAPRKKARVHVNGLMGLKIMLVQIALWLPPWAFPVIWFLKIAGIVAYLAQLPFTYLVVRLDYEMRWYMVTDRSLRIRFGIWKVNESTMSFANIQQVVVSQGPVQRLLGLSDVHVQSAGGAGSDFERRAHNQEDMHLGLFHSVTNATEIRDLVLERLRRFRQAGLGDPDDHHDPVAPAPGGGVPPPRGESPADDAIAAARELLAEVRALRATLV
ncbi:MAG TPA: PH domain-containing protein [Lacunisphaera sp.]|jgi:membrane protein YdbS with pleckstrin-like domain|nr:PH domain-containing protein [Lacunisphaera sp.]